MLDNLRITKKLPLTMILLALVSSMVTGLVVYSMISSELERAAEEKLASLLQSRKSALHTYFDTLESDLEFHAQSRLVVNALQDFYQSWKETSANSGQFLNSLYSSQHTSTMRPEDSSTALENQSDYATVHSRYHPQFRNLLSARKFYDLFLIGVDGSLVYSVAKESDFATNLLTGKWKHTDLARVFRQINAGPGVNNHGYSDFARYEPSNNAPASFMGAPVFNENLAYIGALVFQMPIEPLNKIMQLKAGMGESGETYVVGRDLLMRSDSRFMQGNSILELEVDTSSVKNALEGNSGVALIDDYRGTPVYSAYAPVDFRNIRWAILAEIDKEEVLRPIMEITWLLFLTGLAIALVISIAGHALSLGIAKPIISMTDMMARLSRNELSIDINVPDRKDEIGDMAKAMIMFKRAAIERDALQKELSHLAHHDQLTGLPTRKFAMERLAGALGKAGINNKYVAVMFADIDNFKAVNDTLGHHVGDELLRSIAHNIKSALREGDTVGRVGGDEFIVILPDLPEKKNAESVANKILRAVVDDLAKISTEFSVSLSLGVALYPSDATDASLLIRHADESMYIAKRRGKNNVCVSKQA